MKTAVQCLVKVLPTIGFVLLLFCSELVSQCSPTPASDKPVAVKIFEIGQVSQRVFRRQMETFWKSYDSTVPLYIVTYGTDAEVAKRERVITNLISYRNFDRARITLVRGGGKEARTVIWKVPYGADDPKP